ncbi:hypothetical protein [Vibrio cyclitrophicus]|uniref:hypothetical protein n=1 Tax=Vibrio cyclitrophicus TaxID=47951 RepID=UPI0018E44F5B|nr:hypothetical protein [Vibrio cyclitrophicus]MDH5895852.1 hypothetical protein [Vibrio splendidus]
MNCKNIFITAVVLSLTGCSSTPKYNESNEVVEHTQISFRNTVNKADTSSFRFLDSNGDVVNRYDAKVGISKGGKVNLYFEGYAHQGSQKLCTFTNLPTSTVYKINGQNVQMLEFCSRPSDSTTATYSSAAAETDVGKEYIDSQFRNYKSVIVEYRNGARVSFDSDGYENAMKVSGGNAL